MRETSRASRNTERAWKKLAAGVVGLLAAAFILALCSPAQGGEARGKLVGMYVHQHWPYHHPYAARTWTLEDWRGYAEGLHRLGYNAVLDTRFDPFAPPKLLPGETPFQYVARKLAGEESNTPRLLKGLEAAWKRVASGATQP